ncbi:hypothetical protein OHB35_38735 [Streptomyces phaeochromogenes]|uniref:Uncharacterized protein n=1 Tax=Streptomyces phaeochromogenes TaxID=1923 RepID=A0ABZ1HNC3_STRPH|nr:hypothetical protein [Streptomyces phaeochromogenes]WSD18700.1 hypothetical protein OHB35_38735 [Streptomyces phaeochromogenes]
MKDVHEELRATLRDAAEAHEPDRARILARVERGMAGTESARYPSPRSSPLGWFRVVGATAAAAGVLAVGGYAVASAVKDDKAADQTVATSPTPDPSPEATSRAPVPPDPAKSSPPPDRPSTPNSPTAGPTRTTPVAPPAKADDEDGPLWSDGSVDPHSNEFWAQSNVTLKTSKQLTALTVELKVKQTGGVTSTGAWRSAPEDDFTVTVAEKDGFLVYTWALKPGRTVGPGEWVFAGQYDHDRGGRDAGDDTYAVGAQVGDQQLGVAGDFARDASDDDS